MRSLKPPYSPTYTLQENAHTHHSDGKQAQYTCYFRQSNIVCTMILYY